MDNFGSFKVCTFNCNGLGDIKKRKDVFHNLRSKNCDIYLLQETHLKTEDEKFIRSNWGYNIWLSGIDSNKNGVAVLFNNSFEYKMFDVHRDPQGCYIALDVEIFKKRCTIMNIYGPSRGDQPEFLNDICRVLENIGNERILIAGDWNCALNMKIDARNYASLTNRPRTRKAIFDMMCKYNLYDVFRELYENQRVYTWRKFNSIKQARLDYFLTSEDVQVETKGIQTLPGYRSDHSFVILELNKEEFKRDRPFWKFNNSLLKDRTYIDTVKKIISETKQQYILPVYNLENISNIPNHQLSFQISDQLFFETLMMEIRGKTISYATFKKKTLEAEEKDLESIITEMEKNVDDSNLVNLEEAKVKLQNLRNYKMEGIAIRSKAKWHSDGEKVSRYFCSLENRNFLDKAMHTLEKENGEVISDQKEILSEVKDFYSNLYEHRDVKNIDLYSEISDAPKLSEIEKNKLEGPITFYEAKEALKEMKNFKSPGSDGFTVEFFKFFFSDIGEYLVRSVNEGFDKGYLSISQRQGIIVCIPKDGKPKKFIKNWRPITLLNVAYKIASACIANRLKIVLPTIIHDSQRGFLKGRYIGESIRLIYDTLIYTDRNNIPGMILAIDFEKAFDSVSWSFLQKCLSFFNFGPNICQWIKTLYCNITTCVYVNGQYSHWFEVARGVRQGDPSSPYLYLICAEILSIFIRQNRLIKGIKLRDKESLLSQFADDTTLCLDGSEQSFNEAISVLLKFAEISGLKMNIEKTNISWIGSTKHCNVRFMRDKNFIWDPGIYRILGIKFSVNTEIIMDINYQDKLLEMKRVMTQWKKRHLTPLGKITVMKTLILPKITYLLINLPDPPQRFITELEKEVYKFLWDGKNSKIKKSVVCQTYARGGLRMVDIKTYITVLKLSWIKRLQFSHSLSEFIFDLYPDMEKLRNFGNEFVKNLQNNIDNPFWKDVLKHFLKLHCHCSPKNIDEFLSECIFYNDNILRGNEVLCLKEWCELGIFFIHQLIHNDGKLMTFFQFKQAFPQVNTSFLLYNGVISAIKSYQEKCQVVFTDNFRLFLPKAWFIIMKGNRYVQTVLLGDGTKPTSVTKWNSEFVNLEWESIFRHCFTVSKDVQLRWFQARLLHRLLPTEKYLFNCKIATDPMCNLCHQEEQTIRHLFAECIYAQHFWEDFQKHIVDKCQHTVNFKIDDELILFGVKMNVKSDGIMDFLILCGKFFIYKCKIANRIPTFQQFLPFLKDKYKVESYSAAIQCRSHDFRQNWFPYMFLITN